MNNDDVVYLRLLYYSQSDSLIITDAGYETCLNSVVLMGINELQYDSIDAIFV